MFLSHDCLRNVFRPTKYGLHALGQVASVLDVEPSRVAAMVVYGVKGGPKAGVYNTWAEASAAATGVSGALPKKFSSEVEARHFAFPRVTDLWCPFDEKEEVKRLGAKWDGRIWYVPVGMAPAAFSQWLPSGGGAAAPPVAAAAAPAPKRGWPQMHDPRPPHDAPTAPFVSPSTSGGCDGLRAGELALFTDGACKGNNNVALNSCAAGWGVAVVAEILPGLTTGGRVVCELCGPVVLDATSPHFLGSEVGSNNTGELSAVCEALLYLIHEPVTTPACICYDSEYAAKQAQGLWKVNKNRALVHRAQALLAHARARRQVRFLHVKGHSGHQWNDRADALANAGAAGSTCRPDDGIPAAVEHPVLPTAPPPQALPQAPPVRKLGLEAKARLEAASASAAKRAAPDPPPEVKRVRSGASVFGLPPPAMLSLADKAEALRGALGTEGTIPAVAKGAAEILSVSIEGLGLAEAIEVCYRAVYRLPE